MAQDRAEVFGGVDTHKHVHVAAAMDAAARLLGTAEFAADAHGYEQLLGWLRSHGSVARVGVEGTGSYGAGLARHLTVAGAEVVEVNRPNRQMRRRRGKTDTVDAEAAARTAPWCARPSPPMGSWRRFGWCLWRGAPQSRPVHRPPTRSADSSSALPSTSKAGSEASTPPPSWKSAPAGDPSRDPTLLPPRPRPLCALWHGATRRSPPRLPSSMLSCVAYARRPTRRCSAMLSGPVGFRRGVGAQVGSAG